MRITTVSSGLTTTQAPISGEPSAARTTAGPPKGRSRPMARPAPSVALPMTKARRLSRGEICLFMWGFPYALAIVWIASRTCWKVPQRQILVIASSISASVGFGFSFSSAATAMIMPLWQ
ncbi:hypothetical protein ABH978_006824 [Bradyrhizobium ottawaense]